MKRLIELRYLLLICSAFVLFCTVVPVQTANAGFYVEYEYWYDYADEDVYDPNENFTEDGSAYSYSGSLYSSCDAWAYAEAWILNMAGSFSCGFGIESWAYSDMWWEWEGSGTPTGGTLEYSFHMEGDASVIGYTSIGIDCSASAASSGDSYASGEGSGYASASGGVSDQNQGSASASYSGDSGSAYEEETQGNYYADAEFEVFVDDDEEFSAGTSYISVSVSVSCEADATANVYSPNSNGSASADADADSSAHSHGGASFSSN